MTKKNETAQEEFARRVRELYELAGKMGLRLTIMVKSAQQTASVKSPPREPGEN